MKKIFQLIILFFLANTVFAQNKNGPLPNDVYGMKNTSDIHVSPDGNWVVYVVSTVDTTKDSWNDDIWTTSWDGKQTIQLTNSTEDESSPLFSPDGKYISFLSSRKIGEESDDDDDDHSQVWLLDRRGGEAKSISDVKSSIKDYCWSPDGKHILLVMKDQDFSDTSKTKERLPYVIDRYHFKEDYTGYLDRRATHFYLLDIESGDIDTLTSGKYDESSPAFSPDGKQIAFVSNRTEDPDKNENSDIYVMDAKPGADMKQLTTWEGSDTDPRWSTDGKWIAYQQSFSNEKFTMFGNNILALISSNGGTPKLLSAGVERNIVEHQWSKDGNSIAALMEDNRRCTVVLFGLDGKEISRPGDGDHAIFELQLNKANGQWATLMSDPHLPFEVFVLENGVNRRLTTFQEDFIQSVSLAKVEGFQSVSKDGTLVPGLLYTPSNAAKNKPLPLIMYIHGGPVGQDDYEFEMTAQMLAEKGFAVAQINYRGSTGSNNNHIRAIMGDWGDKEVIDINGAVDYLIEKGIADSTKLGIFGWSYGGILTDYSIATNQRFKAASSGAGSALQLSMYGTDQYITQYNNELGPPWKNLDKWIQISYPFLHADRINTPTLFMASQNDFNVPVAGAEQMYQALKTTGVPTELVIYPNQNHGLEVPSYIADRLQRYIDWFSKYLK